MSEMKRFKILSEYTQEKLNKQQFDQFKIFITKHKFLKLLPRDDYNDEFVEIHIWDAKVKARGPDDKIYGSKTIEYADRIRDEITRGCILVHCTVKKTKQRLYFIFQGFAKFSGLTDQDDDDLSKMQEKGESIEKDVFYLGPKEDSTKIVEITKENGKAAHFACFKADDKIYYVCGSKNVHVIFTDDPKSLVKYEGRNNLHVTIAHGILNELNNVKKKEFVEMMCNTGLLANFEFMMKSDQHIVNYDFSKKDIIFRFLCFTGRRSYNTKYKEQFGKLFPVDVSLEYGKYVGFEIPKYTLHKIEGENKKGTLEKIIEKTRNEQNSEGSVLYLMKDNFTLGLSKTKTIFYIFFRAMREKLKRKPNNFNELIKKRFKDIQKWLKLSDEEIMKWRVTAFHFNNWLKKREKESDDFKNLYADLVENFRKSFTIPRDLKKAIEEICDEPQ